MRITEESMKQENPELNGPGQLADSDDLSPQAPQPKLTEREKLSHMNTKDKLWYIWAYYKWYFAGVIIAVILLAAIGNAAYQRTFDTAIHIVAVNTRSGEEDLLSDTMDTFHDAIGLGEKELVVAESMFINYEEHSEYSMANMTKIATLAAARDLDAVIGDTTTIDFYASSGAFYDLTTLLSPEVLETVKDRLYYAVNDVGESCACAIDISGTAFAEESGLTRTTPLFGISLSSERKETSLKLLTYIFE